MFTTRNIPRDGALNRAGQQRRARTGQRQSLIVRSIANIQSIYSSLTSKNKKTAQPNIRFNGDWNFLWRPGRNDLLVPVSELNCPIAITILNFHLYYRQFSFGSQQKTAENYRKIYIYIHFVL